MEQSINSRSHYCNYKGIDSIVLQAMVRPEYEFLCVDVGINGRISDGVILDQCPLKDVFGIMNLIFPLHYRIERIKSRTFALVMMLFHS